jgi:signal transduction histidine kinase
VVHVGSLAILGVGAVAALASMVTGSDTDPPDPFFGAVIVVVVASYTTLGRLIVTRTGNRIGWVFLAMGAGAAIGFPAEGYLQSSFREPYVATLPGTDVAGWIAGLVPAMIALAIPMLFLLFPTGTPPTPRWRWVARLWLVGTVLSLVWLAFRPGSIYGEPGRFSIENPFGLAFLDDAGWLFLNVGTAFVLGAAIASVVSLVVRFRRATGDERQQIKWLMFVGVTAASIFVTMFVLEAVLPPPSAGENSLDDLLWIPLVLVLLVGPPVATAIAVFRYHLYDLDVVISKTIVFAVLAVFITIAYVAIVAVAGALLDVGATDPALSIAAIAVVAVGFHPARVRARKLANRLVYGDRATPYEVLARFSERVGGTYSTDDALPRTARVIAEGTGAARVEIWLHVADELRREAIWPAADDVDDVGIVLSVADLEAIEADRKVPVRLRGELLGAIGVTERRTEPFTAPALELLDRLADQAALILANVRLTADLEARLETIARQAAELRTSRQRIVAAQDDERKRLERNIHDGAQQHLVALAVQLRLAKATLARNPERALSMLEALAGQVDAAIDTLDALALGIYPPLLQELGVAAALAAQFERGETPVRMHAEGAGRYPIEIEAAAYFCVLEALQNASKHARARSIEIVLTERDGTLTFEVHDDGRGFDPEASRDGTGIEGMRDRLAVFGGDVSLRSAPGEGTLVVGRIPLPGVAGRPERPRPEAARVEVVP